MARAEGPVVALTTGRTAGTVGSSWRGNDRLELCLARERRLPFTDPAGRGTLLGCGCALHHLRVALVAGGMPAEVVHLAGADRAVACVRARRVDDVAPAARRRSPLRS